MSSGAEALVASDEQPRGSGVDVDVRGAVVPGGAGTGDVGEETVEARLRRGGGVEGGERGTIRADPDVVGAAQVFEHVKFGGVRAVAPRVLGDTKHAHGEYAMVVAEGGGEGVFLGGSMVGRGKVA